MIDFLNYVGIDKKTIMEMKQRYTESDLYDLASNQDNCLKIIEYFKNINIKNINILLINELDLFLLTFEEMIKKLAHFNIPIFVDAINNDYLAIEEIYNV